MPPRLSKVYRQYRRSDRSPTASPDRAASNRARTDARFACSISYRARDLLLCVGCTSESVQPPFPSVPGTCSNRILTAWPPECNVGEMACGRPGMEVNNEDEED